MKLTIARAVLLKALDHTTRIVERRNTIPILGNIRMVADGERLELSATDLDLTATAATEAQVSEPGATTVPAATLHDIVRKLPEKCEVTIETIDDGARVTVRAGRSRFLLGALPAADWPSVVPDTDSGVARFPVPAKLLGEVLSQVSFAIADDEARYYLNGVHVHLKDDHIVFVATDGHRLARRHIDKPEVLASLAPIIVPRKTVVEITRLLKDAGDREVSIDVSARTITATIGNTVLTSKLIDGTFPDYLRVIPTGNDKAAIVDAKEFAAAIDRVATLSTDRGRSIKLAWEAGKCLCSVVNADLGEASDEVTVEYDAEPLTIGFNSRYLGEVMATLGGDTARISMANPASPALFQTKEDAPLLIVLMPMRT